MAERASCAKRAERTVSSAIGVATSIKERGMPNVGPQNNVSSQAMVPTPMMATVRDVKVSNLLRSC